MSDYNFNMRVTIQDGPISICTVVEVPDEVVKQIRADERTRIIKMMNKLWKDNTGWLKAETRWFELKKQLKEVK